VRPGSSAAKGPRCYPNATEAFVVDAKQRGRVPGPDVQRDEQVSRHHRQERRAAPGRQGREGTADRCAAPGRGSPRSSPRGRTGRPGH
jgi:hypothetical protein